MQFYYLNPASAPSTLQLYTLIIQSYSYTPNTASCQNQNTAPDEPLPSPSSSESSAGKKAEKTYGLADSSKARASELQETGLRLQVGTDISPACI